MSDRRIPRRTRLLAFSLSAFWVLLVVRVGQLQLGGAEFRSAANSQRTTAVKVPTTTGRLLDRRGRPLAVSIRQPSLFVDPSRVDDPTSFAKAIAPIIGRKATDLASELRSNRKRQFRWLKRRTSEDVVAQIRVLDLPERSWGIREELRRIYPQGSVAAQVIGLRGLDGDAAGGLEKQFAEVMTGEPGERRLVADSLGRPLSLLSEISSPPVPGDDIPLTLDARLSTLVGRRLDALMNEREPTWATVLVMDPRDGHLLAIESRPAYDPNNPVAISTGGFNYAFNATFEPGSTVKPLVVAAALSDGAIDVDDTIDCGPGVDHVAGRPMRDAVPMGLQPLAAVLSRSSNIGSARVAERLGASKLYAAFRDFGFGQPVKMEFGPSTTGSLAPVSEWSGYSLGSLAMGHELAVTPLQLVNAYAMLVAGRTGHPTLVTGDGSLVEQSQPMIEPAVSAWIVQDALKQAVESGTAKSMKIPGVSVFGKTGTAQKFDPELGRYRTDRATCVVVAGAPAEAPSRLVLVVVDDPTLGPPFSGGKVAGPVARDVLDDAMSLIE